mmetsp:Transcript_16208/g.39536  ORF Transcript_16208/g.39536 Transcript_16208/m.39536 type:complete len:260 (-) Transcript_16208:5-784(-)
MKKCASLQSTYMLQMYSPAAHMEVWLTWMFLMVSVRLVVKRKNSLPFLLRPLMAWPLLTKILSLCSAALPVTSEVMGALVGRVLNTATRSSFLHPSTCTTPSLSPSPSLLWRLPLPSGNTVMVPRSACEVCVISVRANESDILDSCQRRRRPTLLRLLLLLLSLPPPPPPRGLGGSVVASSLPSFSPPQVECKMQCKCGAVSPRHRALLLKKDFIKRTQASGARLCAPPRRHSPRSRATVRYVAPRDTPLDASQRLRAL